MQERSLVLRIGWFTRPFKARELFCPSLPHGFDDARITMADKILEGSLFAIFFAHEEQRDVGRKKSNGRGQLQPLERNHCCEAVSERSIAHLIVILRGNYEGFPRKAVRRITVMA